MPDRAPDGKFLPGNAVGAKGGRPPRAKEERWNELLRECVTEDDIKAIVTKAVKMARDDGSWRAREFLWDRAVGKPRQAVEVRQTRWVDLAQEVAGVEVAQLEVTIAKLEGKIAELEARLGDAIPGGEAPPVP
jgi:hypothetical protein